MLSLQRIDKPSFLRSFKLRKDLLNAMICIMKFFLLLFFLIPIRSFADWSLVHQDDADHYIDYALRVKMDIRQERGICKITLNHKPLKIFNIDLLKIDQNLIARPVK